MNIEYGAVKDTILIAIIYLLIAMLYMPKQTKSLRKWLKVPYPTANLYNNNKKLAQPVTAEITSIIPGSKPVVDDKNQTNNLSTITPPNNDRSRALNSLTESSLSQETTKCK